MTFDQRLGAAFREIREMQGRSLMDVYGLTGIPPSTLGAYERGDRALLTRKTVALARVYGISPLWLLDRAGEAEPFELETPKDPLRPKAGMLA